MSEIVVDSQLLLLVRILRLRAHIAHRQVARSFEFPMPALESVLCGVAQLKDGRRGAFAQLDVELERSNAVLV